MTMIDWHPMRKRRFRGEVLKMLSSRHCNQQSRLNDLLLLSALQSVGVQDIELRDVVTICQDMKGRGWLTYEQITDPVTRREQLHRIEICPEGQDLLDQTTHSSAVSFI